LTELSVYVSEAMRLIEWSYPVYLVLLLKTFLRNWIDAGNDLKVDWMFKAFSSSSSSSSSIFVLLVN